MAAAVGGYVLDTPALVGACGREPYPEAIVWGTVLSDGVLVVPTSVVAETRARISTSENEILEVILGLSNAVVTDLDLDIAKHCGRLLSRLPEKDHGWIAAAHVAAEAMSREWPVATARAQLLLRLHAGLDIDPLP